MKIVYANGFATPDEVIKLLSLTNQSGFVFRELVKNLEVVKKAKELKIKVKTEELQKFADHYRTILGLHSANETHDFFENSGVTVEDFEAFCESSLLVEKVKERLADEQKIQAYYYNNRSDFDLARISIIVVRDNSLAREILMQINEEGADFHALARKFSEDEATKFRGGYVGEVTRKMLTEEVAAKVFNTKAGGVLGPVVEEGGFRLILVEEVWIADFNSKVKDVIKERIFEEWLSSFVKDGIKILP